MHTSLSTVQSYPYFLRPFNRRIKKTVFQSMQCTTVTDIFVHKCSFQYCWHCISVYKMHSWHSSHEYVITSYIESSSSKLFLCFELYSFIRCWRCWLPIPCDSLSWNQYCNGPKIVCLQLECGVYSLFVYDYEACSPSGRPLHLTDYSGDIYGYAYDQNGYSLCQWRIISAIPFYGVRHLSIARVKIDVPTYKLILKHVLQRLITGVSR